MPASSVSGLFSTAVYFVSMLLLLAVLVNPVIALYRGASLQSAKHLSQSISGEIDDLTPGMVTTVEFDAGLGTQASVHLSGEEATATVNGQSANSTTAWPSSNFTLVAGTTYKLYLSGGTLQVA